MPIMILSNVNDDDHVKSGSLWISGIVFLSNVNGDGGLAVRVVGSSRYSGFNWERIKSWVEVKVI